MRWTGLVVLAVGCFSPRAPSGVICDPIDPRCPDGQQCRPQGGEHVCKEPGVDEPDAAPDVPGDPFAYITFAQAYSASVFQDYSANFNYVAVDWMEATESYDNQPDYLFALRSPFPQALGVIAGRKILVLTGTTYDAHDFGNHAPNAGGGQADNLTGAMYVSDLDGTGPALVVSSASEDTGDGSFRVTPQWAISLDLTFNNTRCVLQNAPGGFDAQLTAQRYLGAQNGIIRRSDSLVIAPGDTRSMRVVGNDLYTTRFIPLTMTEQLIRIASGTHAETMLAERTRIRIVEGAPPAGYVAWAIIDFKQLALIAADGGLTVVAETTDSAYAWTSAVVPPAGHPLVNRLYLLESNRALDLDRVLAIKTP